MQWIKSGKVGVTVHNREEILDIISDIQILLSPKKLFLKKWETKTWGEIPADFGRK